MASSIITSKGQITVPKEVRGTLGLETGERLAFRVRDDGVVELQPETFDALPLWHDQGDRSRRHGGPDAGGHPHGRVKPMIALDTNVLVRFLAEDDAAQTKRANASIRKAQTNGWTRPGLVDT